ncbi:MAG TPA: GTP 3',8-cyclase MoaA [Thermoanaerobaculia bacterium]|nr:GTP 3',8-cyclase MoaA [Thermoanaerobaculia bacterium]
MATLDRYGRRLGNLRLSVTDRCNLRCAYCMPEREYVWLPRRDILDFEEIGRLADVFGSLGTDRIRLTGGEPLVRHELPKLVELLAAKPWLRDLAMTTNGVLLEAQAERLRSAGLHRITVSLDTLRPERFRELARVDELPRVLRGIEAASRAGFASLKLDTVVIRGVNDDEIVALLERAKDWGAEIRFIEYMDVGGATHWSRERVVSREGILRAISDAYGSVEPLGAEERAAAPAERFRLPDGTTFGVIASTTAPFCAACDRSRLTADGVWYLCLYAARGIDLRKPLREGASDDELRALLSGAWSFRTDRGAEERLGLRERTPLREVPDLRKDPHLEMHTRGG